MSFSLKEHPDWHAAAQELVVGLQHTVSEEDKISLFELICERLGDSLYPDFLQILYTVEKHADEPAITAVAQTLVACLWSGRLPSGRLSAWGAITPVTDSAFGQTRLLGPIEYVCTWYQQPGDKQPLSQLQFTEVLTSLLILVSSHPPAQRLYYQKLLADVDDPVGGSWTNQSRTAMRAMLSCWDSGDKNDSAVEAYLNALQAESLLHQVAKGPADI